MFIQQEEDMVQTVDGVVTPQEEDEVTFAADLLGINMLPKWIWEDFDMERRMLQKDILQIKVMLQKIVLHPRHIVFGVKCLTIQSNNVITGNIVLQ